jgi:N-acetylglucosaminyldiphosphoundecaprenol N-acetyl-beta-D-mannosaminyltransferase
MSPHQRLGTCRHERHRSFPGLARPAAQYALSIVIALAAQKIKESRPHAEIVGYRDGYFSNNEIQAIRDEVCRAKPTLLLIALGSPRQEQVALEFLQLPDLQVVWTVGGLFDFLSGRIVRAPTLIQMRRLEWLLQIFIEPRRLAPRYLFNALWLAKSRVYG